MNAALLIGHGPGFYGSGSDRVALFVAPCVDCNRLMHNRGCGQQHWVVDLSDFGAHIVAAPTRDAAKYRSFRFAREAGYFNERQGFHRFITSGVTVSRA